MEARYRRRMLGRRLNDPSPEKYATLDNDGSGNPTAETVNSDDNLFQDDNNENENTTTPSKINNNLAPPPAFRMTLGGSQRSSFNQFTETYENKRDVPSSSSKRIPVLAAPLSDVTTARCQANHHAPAPPPHQPQQKPQDPPVQVLTQSEFSTKFLSKDIDDMSAMDFSAADGQNAFRAALTAAPTVDTNSTATGIDKELETILDEEEPPSLRKQEKVVEAPSVKKVAVVDPPPPKMDEDESTPTNRDTSSTTTVKRPPRLEPAPFDESKSRRKKERERILRLMNGLDALLVETPTNTAKTSTTNNKPTNTKTPETVATVGAQKAQERVKIESLVHGLDALLVDTPPKKAACSNNKGSTMTEEEEDHGELELKPTPTDEVSCNEKVVASTQPASKWATPPTLQGEQPVKGTATSVIASKGATSFGATLLQKRTTELHQKQSYENQLQGILEQRRRKSEEIANTDLEAGTTKATPTTTKPNVGPQVVKKPSPARSSKLEARMAVFEPAKKTGTVPASSGGGSTISMASSYEDTVFTVQDRIKAFAAQTSPPLPRKTSPNVSCEGTDSPACLPFLPAAVCSSIPMVVAAPPPAATPVSSVPEVATPVPDTSISLKQPQDVASALQVHGPESTDPANQVATTPTTLASSPAVPAPQNSTMNYHPGTEAAQSLLHSSGANSASHPGQVNNEGLHADQQQHANSTVVDQPPVHPTNSQYLQQQHGFNPDSVQFNQLTGSPIPTPAQYAKIYVETQVAGGGVPWQLRPIESAPQMPQQQPMYNDRGQQQALYHGGQGQQYNGNMRAEKNQSPYTLQATGSAPSQPMMSHQQYGSAHPPAQYQMGQQHFPLPPVQGPRAADIRERIMIPQPQHQPLPNTEDLMAQYPRFPMPSPVLPPPRHYRQDSNTINLVPRHSNPATVPHYDNTARPPFNGNNHGLPLYRNSVEVNTVSNQSLYGNPPMARKVLARSVESQLAQAYHGSNEKIMDNSLAATPIAKTKHSRYHRGGRFLDDQVGPLEASLTSLDRSDDASRRTPKTPNRSSRRSRSRTPKSKPKYRREPSELDDEAGTTVTEFLNGSRTYSSSDDEDDDDPTAANGAFGNNVMGMFDNMKFPSFTNCITSTHGVLDSVANKNPCAKPVQATRPRSKSKSRSKNGKQKRSGQRRKSTSSLDTRDDCMRSPYHGETQRRADDDFCVNIKRQEPNGIHFD